MAEFAKSVKSEFRENQGSQPAPQRASPDFVPMTGRDRTTGPSRVGCGDSARAPFCKCELYSRQTHSSCPWRSSPHVGRPLKPAHAQRPQADPREHRAFRRIAQPRGGTDRTVSTGRDHYGPRQYNRRHDAGNQPDGNRTDSQRLDFDRRRADQAGQRHPRVRIQRPH